MISRAQFDAYNQATANIANEVSSLVEQRINAWVAQNPNASVSEIRNAAKEIMNEVIPVYNDSIAELGAQLWDATARDSGVAVDRAITTQTFSEQQIEKVAHYQARKLISADYSGFARACGEFASNNAMLALNETMLANAKRDKKGARFARVPTGKETCAFCLMLATRGAVYWSRKSAGEFNHFHRNCDCKVVPSYEGQYGEYVEGYSAKALDKRLTGIAKFYGIGDPYTHISDMNKVLQLYSPEYLVFGETPTVTYESEEAKAYKAKDKNHRQEVFTAQALSPYGLKTEFIIDQKGQNGLNVGLADLSSGLELKTLKDASSFNTINEYLKKASKKQGAIAIVFDNRGNNGLTDDELLEMLRRKKSFKNGIVLMLGKGGQLVFAR